eukprot:COSAG05_NODE_8738_length_676_cov_1.064125_2_plen_27_part_01
MKCDLLTMALCTTIWFCGDYYRHCRRK